MLAVFPSPAGMPLSKLSLAGIVLKPMTFFTVSILYLSVLYWGLIARNLPKLLNYWQKTTLSRRRMNWLLTNPIPSLSCPQVSLFLSLPLWRRSGLLTGEGANSFDGEKGWSCINHSILSGKPHGSMASCQSLYELIHRDNPILLRKGHMGPILLFRDTAHCYVMHRKHA